MEHQQNSHSEYSTGQNIIDRIFKKARGVELFPEEKSDILTHMKKVTVPVEIRQ